MDIKKTSYKKLSKLLSTFEKKVLSSCNVVPVRRDQCNGVLQRRKAAL